MCGRFSLTKIEKELETRFGATFYTEELERYQPLPNFNVAPTQFLPVITSGNPSHFNLYRWGLIPFWARDKSVGSKMINARLETLGEKAAFKDLVSTKRCLIPMDGFYEWERIGKTRRPYRIITDCPIFSVAGLWSEWIDKKTSETVRTFTIITLPANEIMSKIHDRMPAILSQADEKIWLDNDIKTDDLLKHIATQYPSDLMEVYRVSDRVNNVRETDASLIEFINTEDENDAGKQLSLF